MSRITKILKDMQKEMKSGDQNVSPFPESPDVSSIEKASFLQEDQCSLNGNPLHSTALDIPQSDLPKTTEEKSKGKNKKTVTETPKRSQVEKPQNKTSSKENEGHTLQRTKTSRTKSQTPHTTSKKQENKGKKKEKNKGSGSDEALNKVSHSQRQKRPSLSSENLTDEDESFHPSNKKRTQAKTTPKKPRPSSSQQKQKRKSSSGSSDHGEPAKKRKPQYARSLIDLDVVLEEFKEFITEYKETVHSESVKKTIDAFSDSFEEQLTETIKAIKELNSVKRDAVKVNSSLTRKKTRLLEAKNELIRSEAQLEKLQKEYNKMDQRLKALTKGTAFLTNLKELNRSYLQHRINHPNDPETYGPSCIPAMLLEAKSINGTENQLHVIGDQLQELLQTRAHK